MQSEAINRCTNPIKDLNGANGGFGLNKRYSVLITAILLLSIGCSSGGGGTPEFNGLFTRLTGG